ncbi:MAG: hypothetical protein VX341_08140 [Bdellovibrionota bacterium]|nr:hypothetical protein [Bdellovibrionota bacterium]
MDIEKLTNTMIDFIFRQNRKYTVVKRDRLSIKEKLQFLKEYLEMGQKTNFEDLLEKDTTTKSNEQTDSHSIDNVVITFISLLELARLKRIEIFQNEDNGNIYVDVVKSLSDFDVTQADGFEDENEQNKEQDNTVENQIH